MTNKIDLDNFDPTGDPTSDLWGNNSKSKAKTVYTARPRCHNTHEPLPVSKGFLIGGNCRDHDRHKDVDWFIALDGMQQHPHYKEDSKPVRCSYYPITNMSVPTNPSKFHSLVQEIADALDTGLTVHVGCIGGHGRTGLVIAAVLAHMGLAPKDVVNYVKKIYCHKAVESSQQVDFLVKYYDAEKVEISYRY